MWINVIILLILILFCNNICKKYKIFGFDWIFLVWIKVFSLWEKVKELVGKKELDNCIKVSCLDILELIISYDDYVGKIGNVFGEIVIYNLFLN